MSNGFKTEDQVPILQIPSVCQHVLGFFQQWSSNDMGHRSNTQLLSWLMSMPKTPRLTCFRIWEDSLTAFSFHLLCIQFWVTGVQPRFRFFDFQSFGVTSGCSLSSKVNTVIPRKLGAGNAMQFGCSYRCNQQSASSEPYNSLQLIHLPDRQSKWIHWWNRQHTDRSHS